MAAIVGGYELVSRIAVGGMAEVFLARKAGPEGFEKRLALKRILPHLSHQPDFVSMFLDEARVAARLDHPHIVHIHDFGQDGDNYYLAMEHVAGADLSSIIRRSRAERAPIAFADAATLLIAACEALHHAHEQGVVHRDVTPSNLLVSYDGVVKLADFGIAKLDAGTDRTRSGALKGKVPYMSPEQACGRALDRRTDVYSLGVCAWELLCGRRLFFDDNELALLAKVQLAEVPRPTTVRRSIPRGLETALMRALERSAAARFATAREFGEALSAWLLGAGGHPSQARLGGYMTRLFGADAAARARAPEPPVGPTEVAPAQAKAPALSLAQHPLFQAPQALVQHMMNLPMVLHLHLPPLRLPRLRLLLPILAILLSGFGLVFALYSPHAISVTPAPQRGMMGAAPEGGSP